MSKTDYFQAFEEDKVYHVYNRTNGGEKLFRCDENYRYFLSKWKQYLSPYVATRSFCLIPNHFHFQIRVHEVTEKIKAAIAKENSKRGERYLNGEAAYSHFIEGQLKRMLSSYVLSFNKKYNRNGSLLQKRTRRVVLIDATNQCRNIAYNHHNPIHHNLCDNYGTWKWCSYNAFLSDQSSSLAREECIDLFGGFAAFLAFHESFKMSEAEAKSWEP